MGLLDNYTGIGMSPRPSREHQRIMASLLIGIRDEAFYTLSEECVDELDRNSPAPDVVIFDDEESPQPFAIIEITKYKELKAIQQKVQQLLNDYSFIQEAFIYDYEKDTWYCYGEELDSNNPSFSNYMGLDLADYI